MRILSAHRAVIDGIIEFHEGRIVGTAGDSVLAEFGSSVEAVRCAVEIQEALKTRNDALPEERRLFFRIGVNLGDVMVKGEDLLGDGVNVAARLQGIAEPGGICISSSVYDQIAGKLNLGFMDIGDQALKNICARLPRRRHEGRRPGRAATLAPRGNGGCRRGTRRGHRRRRSRLAGWLVPGAGDREETAATSATDADAARAEQERRAAEDHARAQAELTQARAEAEAAKRRAESEAVAAAEARRALEAQRTAEARARAETELAQARTEAEAIKRQAQAELAAATKTRQESETKVAHVAPPAGIPAPASVSASRFDGQWMMTRSCEAIDDRPGFVDKWPATVSKGEFFLERGQRGQPGYQALRGKPADSGNLILTGISSPGARRFTGQELPVFLEGRFDGERFQLEGTYGRRSCSVVIARMGN